MCGAYFLRFNALCQTGKLTVYARYTRRGGLDINPFRSNFEHIPANLRLARQYNNKEKYEHLLH